MYQWIGGLIDRRIDRLIVRQVDGYDKVFLRHFFLTAPWTPTKFSMEDVHHANLRSSSTMPCWLNETRVTAHNFGEE